MRTGKELRGTHLMATDGSIGTVKDLILDGDQWLVRYLVIDTGKWLPGKKVLISPQAVRTPAGRDGDLPVSLSKDQVYHSPDIDEAQPVSRLAEISLHKHYNWNPYWASAFAPPPPPAMAASSEELQEAEAEAATGSHLRSLKEITGYTAETSGGAVGHVEDVVLDDDMTTVRHFVIDTGHWFSGRKVLIPPTAVRQVSWAESKVTLSLGKDEVERLPDADSELARR